MLTNPSFEGEYNQISGTVRVAPGWEPFYHTGDPPQEPDQGPCAMPEYKELPKSLDPRRVVDGDKAQCWFLNWKVMDAGIFQVVQVEPYQWYMFSVSCQAWCSQGNDPAVSDGEMYVSLGIDPQAGSEAREIGVIWTPWQWVGPEHVRLGSRIVPASQDRLTVFIRVWNKWRLRHNDIYVDAAKLEVVQVCDDQPVPPPSDGVDYDRIRAIVSDELGQRDPVLWPR